MRTESLEYYIILTNSHPQKAWHPYDPTSHCNYDLMKLPMRAKFESYDLAQSKLAACYAQTKRLADHVANIPSAAWMADVHRATEFKVAKVAITVDLLPQ